MEQKLLIVDDEAHIRMLIEQTLEDLEDEGVELLFAENGEQALEMIKQEEPNLVFLDVMMPKMNGLEFIINARKLLPHIIFYIISGFDITDEIQESLDKGLIQKYFKKPFNMNELSAEFELALIEMNN